MTTKPHPEGLCSRGKCCAAARKAIRREKHGPDEDAIHRRTVAELRRTFLRRGYEPGSAPLLHVPNESMVPVRYRAKLQAYGVSKGAPDLLVVHPVVHEGTTYAGLALELKSAKGRPSAEQLRWIGYWHEAGMLACVTRGMDETRDLLLACGLIDREQAERFR